MNNEYLKEDIKYLRNGLNEYPVEEGKILYVLTYEPDINRIQCRPYTHNDSPVTLNGDVYKVITYLIRDNPITLMDPIFNIYFYDNFGNYINETSFFPNDSLMWLKELPEYTEYSIKIDQSMINQ